MENRLKYLVEKSPRTQAAIARDARIGESQFSKLKNRKNLKRTQYGLLERVATALGVSIRDLWDGPC